MSIVKITVDPPRRSMLIHGFISLTVLSITLLFSEWYTRKPSVDMIRATEIMDSSLRCISAYCFDHEINTDIIADPLGTGLIGPELSSITTTAGELAAKRTTINPDFASVIVSLLLDAGVQSGDTLAVGCSGSFPALMIASMAASRALHLEPRVILSLGSSSWGASNPDFNLLDIWQILQDHGLIQGKPAAISLGGEQDTGAGFEGGIAAQLESEIAATGIPLINISGLPENIQYRNAVYFNGHPRSVKAFINTGGSYANLGTSVEILRVPPGLIRKATMPLETQQGMIHSMLRKNIPVIHLLNIKGITRQFNLPWDPASKPKSDFRFYSQKRNRYLVFPSALFLAYFFSFLLLQNRHKKRAG